MKHYSTKLIGCSKVACDCFYGSGNGIVLFNGFAIQEYLKIIKNEETNFQFITIGRIDEQKNPFFIIDVMKQLVKIDSKYQLYWIGSGKLYNDVKNKIEEYNLQNNINLIGATTKIKEYLEKSRYAIYPSKFEGLGIAIVETQLANIFTFYSDVVPDEANIGYSRALSLFQSPKEWAMEINNFVKSDMRSKYKLDEKRYRRFDISSTINQLCEYYDGK